MNKIIQTVFLCLKIWLTTSLVFVIIVSLLYVSIITHEPYYILLLISSVASLFGTVPGLGVLFLYLYFIKYKKITWQLKIKILFIIAFLISMCYALAPVIFNTNLLQEFQISKANIFESFLLVTIGLFICSSIAFICCLKSITRFLLPKGATLHPHHVIIQQLFINTKNLSTIMRTEPATPHLNQLQEKPSTTKYNSLVIKGIITGVLILVMLIPTLFINNLISERENRQKEVVKEVSSKWAAAQTLSAPFITVPYSTQYTNADGKLKTSSTNLILLADQLNVQATINPEIRPRSIYKVLLYKSVINFNGSFKPDWPADINIANIDFTKAKLCFALSDYKGIEEEIYINYNGIKYLLNPTLPIIDLGEVGLSVPIAINVEQLKFGAAFNMQLKLKGSEQLHFLPLSSNSIFNIKSGWPSPSFDGNSLPNTRTYNDSGFTASWKFNSANLPFGTVLKEGVLKATNTAFGVTLVQPADQYNKTSRSVKYAILLIGLSFALFFIVEIMQKKPLHPVQYILIGLALVIFYTLLLSISEYIIFDYAYTIAAAATILLISIYAKGHFGLYKSAFAFAGLLTALYSFVFILIRLEDTALLVGSIGLFIILALVMYVSRKINWYSQNQ